MRLLPALSLVAFAAVVSSSPVLSQISPFEGEAFRLTAEQLRAAAQSTPASAKDPASILYDETSYRIALDQTVRYTHRVIYRIDQPNPPEGWAEATVNWEPWYQKLAMIRARVLLPGGTFVELDPKTVTDAPRTSDEADTFTSGRVRRAPIPGVTAGAIIEEVDDVEDKRAFSHAGFTRTQRFESNVPVAFEKLIVVTPKGMAFQDKLFNADGVNARTEQSGDATQHVYTKVAVAARVASDIDLPVAVSRETLVAFGTGTRWAAAAQEYDGITGPGLAADASLAVFLPARGATRLATIQAIVQRLQKEVRYTGVEFDEASFVPGAPAQTLKRHYGDCKDKSALLVALLRQANIPAHLALLKTGPGRDVQSTMPSLDQFDHAIVYVPAAGADKELWIDATATYNTVGTLPYMDAGRQALIIAPETTDLLSTPAATPENSVLTETREYRLPTFGQATITETSLATGYADANLRALFGGTISDSAHKELVTYAQNVYSAKEVAKVDHTDGSDLLTPFRLSLEMKEAGRGETTLTESLAAFAPGTVWNQLPRWFSEEDSKPSDAADKGERDKAVAARASLYAVQPFRAVKRVMVFLPKGFTPRTLPADKETQVGAGKLTEVYRVESPTLVSATLTFSSGKELLSPSEALEMRDAVVALNKRNLLGLGADETGRRQLMDKQPKQAVATERAAIQAEPRAALPHLHFAQLLLDVGAVDQAVTEAKQAVTLEPASYEAHLFLASALLNNNAGMRFGEGFHRDEAIAEFRKASVLRPDATKPRFELAIAEEFDAQGTRYSNRASMPDAIRDYRTLIQQDPKSPELAQYQQNLLYALFNNGQYADVASTAAALPATDATRGFLVAADLAQHGTGGRIETIRRDNPNNQSRQYVYTMAANLLTRAGKYPEAVQVMQAAMQDGADPNAMNRSVTLFEHLKRVPLELPTGTQPTDPVRGILVGGITGRVDEAMAKALISRSAYRTDAAYRASMRQGEQLGGMVQKLAQRAGMAEAVLTDVIVSNLKLTATGDDANGYVVTAEMIGAGPQSFFVVREPDRYRIVASSTDNREVGAFVLYALDHNQPALARSILNWKREHLTRSDADDAFAGPLFGRFWKAATSEQDATTQTMRLAAISLIANSPDAKPLLSDAIAARKDFDDKQPRAEQRRNSLDLLLAYVALNAGDAATALPPIQELLTEEPDSLTALMLAGDAYRLQKNYTPWQVLLDTQFKKKPNDAALLRNQALLHESQQNWTAARADEKRIIDNGRATEADYNNFAWLGTFSGELGEDTMAAITQANALSKNESFASLHTLATIYALQGRPLDAHAALMHAMNDGNTAHMNEACWLVEGLIEKQLGLPEANATLQRVAPRAEEDGPLASPESSWILAQTKMHEN